MKHILLLVSWLSFTQFVPNVIGLCVYINVKVQEQVKREKDESNRYNGGLMSNKNVYAYFAFKAGILLEAVKHREIDAYLLNLGVVVICM